MKLFTYLIAIFFIVTTLFSNGTNEEQIKVAYVYNFLKNTSWQDENKIEKYRLLIASQNETLKNMFFMLGSRKQLKDKNIEILIYDEKKKL